MAEGLKLNCGKMGENFNLHTTRMCATLRTQLGNVCDVVFSGGEFLELSVDDVWGVYKLCVDESVRLGRESRWCLLLSPSHMRTLHQITNIKAFWRKGTLIIIILVRVSRTVAAINHML